jgi:hypothetical protein
VRWRFRKYLFPCSVIIAGGGRGSQNRGRKMKRKRKESIMEKKKE